MPPRRRKKKAAAPVVPAFTDSDPSRIRMTTTGRRPAPRDAAAAC